MKAHSPVVDAEQESITEVAAVVALALAAVVALALAVLVVTSGGTYTGQWRWSRLLL